MKYIVTFLLAALSLNAVGQTNPNYNPDYDANGVIGVDDLLGILSTFGDTWDSGDVIVGCTYLYAVEYNPSANVDDGSCTFLPDCAGVLNGTSVVDECGVCGGDNSTCLDECGVPNGDNSTCLDECGVPNGDNSSCADCAGVANGTSVVDECGTCDADASNDCALSCGDLVSHEGYDYSTVLIGDQCWFAENCRYLPEVSPSNEGNISDPYYYVNGFEGADVIAAQATDNYSTYGVLYNWPAVMTEGICPSGWHIPTDGEFTELTDFLGGEDVAGAKMKEAGYDHWDAPNTGATNSSGWTGLPGGYRYSGGFSYYGYYGDWWSASESGSNSWRRVLNDYSDSVLRGSSTRAIGFSARCVRD
jgi:uncharacterized protein (TIGR02145 family)